MVHVRFRRKKAVIFRHGRASGNADGCRSPAEEGSRQDAGERDGTKARRRVHRNSLYLVPRSLTRFTPLAARVYTNLLRTRSHHSKYGLKKYGLQICSHQPGVSLHFIHLPAEYIKSFVYTERKKNRLGCLDKPNLLLVKLEQNAMEGDKNSN